MNIFKYLAGFSLFIFMSTAFSQTPEEKILLTIYNKKDNVVLTLKESDLNKYTEASFSSDTPWFNKKSKFKGVLFKEVLIKAGISENSQLQIIAWNNFSAQVPAKDAFEFNTILTTHIDNERINLRNKGPFFLMYPMDNPKFNTGIYYNRSVWQIKEIHEK